jgi:hypothetical protein
MQAARAGPEGARKKEVRHLLPLLLLAATAAGCDPRPAQPPLPTTDAGTAPIPQASGPVR